MKDKKKERKRTRASRRVVEEIAGGKAEGEREEVSLRSCHSFTFKFLEARTSFGDDGEGYPAAVSVAAVGSRTAGTVAARSASHRCAD